MTLEYRTSRVTSNVNNGLSVVMMCQCRFILGNKHDILVSDVDNGRGYACIWEISIFSVFL